MNNHARVKRGISSISCSENRSHTSLLWLEDAGRDGRGTDFAKRDLDRSYLSTQTCYSVLAAQQSVIQPSLPVSCARDP